MEFASQASAVASALKGRCESVAIAYWGEPTFRSPRALRWGNRGSRSLTTAGDKRGLWCDFEREEGGDVLHLIAREEGVSLGEAITLAVHEFLGPYTPTPPSRCTWRATKHTVERTEASKVEWAQKIWREAAPINGTLAERYLCNRGLQIHSLGDVTHALRWHPGIRAVVGLMSDPISHKPSGIHRTFLTKDGAKIDRRMLGKQGVVCLSPDADVTLALGLTEGVEDGLAVLLSGWAPVWAATSAGAVAKFPLLAGISSLTIFADSDAAGISAAADCIERWQVAGREAVIAAPPQAGAR